MSDQVATTGNNLPANPAALLAGLANMSVVANQDASNRGQFMKFAKGDYVYGAESIDVEEDSLWAINPNSFVHGYQAWGAGVLIEEQVAAMNEPPIVKSSLAQHVYQHEETGADVIATWAPYRGFQLVCVEGEDKGLQVFLSGTSIGIKNAVDELIKSLVDHIKEDPSTPVAIVSLRADSYKHKKYGKIFFPVFDIIEWADMDATELPDLEDDDETELSAPDGVDEAGDEQTEAVEPEQPAPEKPRARGRRKAAAEKPKTEQVRTRRRRG